MVITRDNYYSLEASREYKTFSQIKTAIDCPARWLAEINGEYTRYDTDALLHGSYVDIALTEPDKVAEFEANNFDRLHKKTGLRDKLQAVIDLDECIYRAQRDRVFMNYMDGKYQEIIVIDDFHGHKFKCKIDVLKFPSNIGEYGIEVDQKTCKDIYGMEWSTAPDGRCFKLHWIYHWKYHLQRALYRDAVYAKYGFRPHPYIAAIQKGKVPDIQVFDFDWESRIWSALVDQAIDIMNMMDLIRSGDMNARRCNSCDYCKLTRIIDKPTKLEFDPRLLTF